MFKNKFSLIFGFLLIFSALNASESPSLSYVTALNDDQFEDFIQNAEKPVIVDFWAPWCRPCRELKPIFEELACELHEQYLFVSVDIDHGERTTNQYGVETIPTIIVIKDKSVLGKFNGRAAKETLAKNIDNAIHQKLTLETLFSAIHRDDKELVAACLENENIDVNGILHFGKSLPNSWTPLLMSISKVIIGKSTSEVVSMLLKRGALVDMEIESPLFEEKIRTVRSYVEEIAQQPYPENFASLDKTIQTEIVEIFKRATALLELFPPKNESGEE